MNVENIENKVKDFFTRSAKASKDAFEKAGDKVQDFTDKSVVKIEKHQLEAKLDCKYEEMGLKISQMLLDGASILSANESDVKILYDLQEEVKLLADQIREKESLC